MINRYLITLFLLSLSSPIIAQQWDPWLQPGVTLRELNHRPGGDLLESENIFLEARMGVSDEYSNQWSWFIDGRARVFSEGGSLTDENELERTIDNDEFYYLQLREAWIRYSGLTRYPNEYITFGLQRLRERTGLWWDVDIESVSWYGDTTQLDWLVAIGQEFDTYRTSSELLRQNEDVFRVMAEVNYDWIAYHSVDFRFSHADQHTQDEQNALAETAIGANANVRWLSIGLSFDWTEARSYSPWAYHLEWAIQRGKTNLRADGGAVEFRDIDAHALDAGVRYDFRRLPLSVGATFVRGSGGADRSSTKNFSQTGLHTNRARHYGNRQYLHRFNEALRADITNLQQISLFAAWNPSESFESVVLVSKYTKSDDQQPIYVAGRPVDVINGESAVGTSIDINATYYPQSTTLWNLNVLRLRAGFFQPDNGLSDDATDYRVTLEAQFRY
ncbi:alginate export family protein [Alteromonas oceanisediminis]|uniref:alginate export family protein n=1 Tax=Alteromonas oceanisediminis TaxID=2836180 RepID=UPI001BD96AC1|nr:alginate export family protein [Alteromonas oceanisediminis]MBT0585623.1 alginate export family protein [Alteromonas oceanisediminis]